MTDHLSESSGVTRPSPAATDAESIDGVYAALADRQRRAVLAYLRDAEEEIVSVTELVTALADRHSRAAPDRDAIATRLYHVHLPKLADAGLVIADSDASVVRRGETFDLVLAL